MSDDNTGAGPHARREAGQPDEGEGSSRDGFSRDGADREPSGRSPGAASGPNFFERLASVFTGRSPTTPREELIEALASSSDDAEAFSPSERAMLGNILNLREVSVEDVMVTRAEIEAVEIGTRLSELLLIFERSGHSRMPVYSGSLDDLRGIVHFRDVLAHITRGAMAGEGKTGLDLGRVDLDETIGNLNLIRNVEFVPPSMQVTDLMARMQASRVHVALVIDEYGGTDGLVSLEDIVETIVGDIEDEHDQEEVSISEVEPGVYVADGKAEISDAARIIDDAFAGGEHGDYVDTIGGMIVNELGRVPLRGEAVQIIPGFEFQVLDADPRRVKRVRIVRKPSPAGQA